MRALNELNALDDRVVVLENALLELARERNLLLARARSTEIVAGAEAPQPDAALGNSLLNRIGDPVFEEAVRDSVERLEASRATEASNDASVEKIGHLGADRAGHDSAERRDAGQVLERPKEVRQRSAQHWSDETAMRLLLSDAQKAEVTQLSIEYSQAVEHLSESDTSSAPQRDALNARVASLTQQYEERLTRVLNPAQLISYRTLGEHLKLGRDLKQ